MISVASAGFVAELERAIGGRSPACRAQMSRQARVSLSRADLFDDRQTTGVFDGLTWLNARVEAKMLAQLNTRPENDAGATHAAPRYLFAISERTASSEREFVYPHRTGNDCATARAT